ncbi:MAG: phosphoribosylanthranilate isomerase [Bacillota bacterium]
MRESRAGGVWIKICGITTREAALACAEAGADAVGFVFAESRRRITPGEAKRITEILPPDLEKVGVFVDAPWQEVAEIQEYLRLDVLQLHGGENPDYCALFPVKVIKAFRVASLKDLQAVEAYRDRIHACLLDSCVPGAQGGTGKVWDWGFFERLTRSGVLSVERVIVAGGLTPENVVEALRVTKPYGVDTSSGVETGGRKDLLKIRKFIENVRRWERGELAG